VFRNNGNWMLMWEDGMRNFLSAAQHLTMHSSETVRSIKKQGSQVLLHYRVWVRRPVWLILTWAHSSTPREATHGTVMSATKPTLPVLGFNMELHSDKPATNCLPQFTAYWPFIVWFLIEEICLEHTYAESMLKTRVTAAVTKLQGKMHRTEKM